MSDKQGILRIEYLLYAVVVVLLAPYAGCHILTSPPQDITELSPFNDSLSETASRGTSRLGKIENKEPSLGASESDAAREELAEIRELLSK